MTAEPQWSRPAFADLGSEPYELRLYVVGMTQRSQQAIEETKSVCEQYLAGRYHLEVVDIREHPQEAVTGQIVASPTLVRRRPLPARRLVGDLSRRERLLGGLGIPAP